MTVGLLVPRKPFPRWIFPCALAFASYALLALAAKQPGRLPLWIWWGAQASGWIACAWFLRTVASGWPSMRWILLSALAFRCCGLWMTPSLEDDYQRYLWDGWRAIHDGSPYDRPPADFFAVAESRPLAIETALNELNNPDLTTIYAPITEFLFAASAAIAPGSLFVLKVFLLLIDAAVILLLARIGGRAAAWFYGWCPLVIAETAFHAHPEVWAIMWLLAAWLCAQRHRFLFAGAFAGVAIGAKIFAVLAMPFLAWRRPFVFLSASAGALALIYGPLLLAGSRVEWQGLRAMAGGFEFNSLGYALLAVSFGNEAARVFWLFIFGLVALGLVIAWRARKQSLAQAPLVDLLLAFFLLTPVLNPWYLVWLAPFVALRPSTRGVALLVVVPLSYATGLNLADPNLAAYAQPAWVRPLEFGVFLLALASGFWRPLLSWRKQS